MISDIVLPPRIVDVFFPVPVVWRNAFSNVVGALCQGNYTLRDIPSVRLDRPESADRIKTAILEFGETLCDLPDETWTTSQMQWTSDSFWDVFIDLWTVESGSSDLVLNARLYDNPAGIIIEVGAVYVP